MTPIKRHVEQKDGKWYVLSEDKSKVLDGPYDTKEEADKRLEQIEYFKHADGRSAERLAETRFVSIASAEIRVVDDSRLIVGKAVVYNALSTDLGGFREKFLPGAFSEALAAADVRCLIDHKPELILGRNTSGTLRLKDTPEALEFEVDVPECDYGDALLISVKRRDKDGCSFRFYCLTDDWGLEEGCNVRTVAKADIDDVSIVTYPAYLDTTAAVRSLNHFRRGQARRGNALQRELRRLRLADAE